MTMLPPLNAITVALLLAVLAAAIALPAAAEQPAPPSLAESCINLSQVQRTKILSNEAVLFYLRDGRIKKATLAFGCPSLRFYESFGYEVYSNRLCARADSIITRDGTHCPISDIEEVTPETGPDQ